MKRNIYKYTLPVSELKPIIEMPFFADILSVQIQNGKICIWAMINEDEAVVQRQFYVLGTGHGIPDDVEYAIKSNQFKHHATLQQGAFVWHVFENTMPF